ncbi:MAG: tol-pal system protein YbgF [Acidiferrobacterales bacterium]
MLFYLNRIVLILLLLALPLATPAVQWRAKTPEKQKPVVSASQETLLELLTQLESLQGELQQLRNQTEIQQNEIKRLRSRLQDVTSDLDQRLSAIERQGGARKVINRTGKKAPSKPVAVVAGEEQKRYDEAFQLMKQGDYTGAARAFRGFIARYPSSPLASNAQYWIAESNYFVRNFRLSLKEFQKLVAQYPNSRKITDAMLKIGYTYYELGEWINARRALQEVVNRFPRTRNSNSAKVRLRVMKKEGH